MEHAAFPHQPPTDTETVVIGLDKCLPSRLKIDGENADVEGTPSDGGVWSWSVQELLVRTPRMTLPSARRAGPSNQLVTLQPHNGRTGSLDVGAMRRKSCSDGRTLRRGDRIDVGRSGRNLLDT